MKRLTILSCLAVAGSLAASGAWAQNVGAVAGKVVDQDDKPIAGASIVLSLPENPKQYYKGESKKNGEFLLMTGQTSGPWKLTVQKEGYGDYAPAEPFRVPLGGAPLDLGVIRLGPAGTQSAPVAVTKEEAERLDLERRAFQAVRDSFDQAVKLTEEADAATAAGDGATSEQKLLAAAAIYKDLIEKVPDIAEIHYNYGIVLKKQQKWEEAAAEYVKAAEMKPEMIEAYAGAAEAYQKANQVGRTEEMLAKAVTDHPENGKIHYLRGMVLYHLGKYPEATASLKKSQELDPANPEPLFYLGTIAVSEGRTNDCLALLDKYLASNPTRKDNIETAKGLIQALKPAKK